MQGQGTGAHWLTSRNTTNPSLALSQEDRKTDDRERVAGSNQKFGEPQDMARFVDPHYTLQKHPAPLGPFWKNQEPGRPSALSSTSEGPRRPPTAVLAKRRQWWKKRPGNGSSSWEPLIPSLPHFLGVAQEDLA